MENKLIIKLEKEGKLKKQKVGFNQIEALLRQAISDINEAEKIIELSERGAYILAYMAMLKAGRALLLLKGYIPDDGTQHKTVVDVTGFILGYRYKDIIIQFDIMRRKRNEMTYEAGVLISKSETKQMFKDGVLLIKEILKKVSSENPQFILKLDID